LSKGKNREGKEGKILENHKKNKEKQKNKK
jgi:hypothetical protein